MNTLEWNAEEIVEPSIPFQSRYDSGRARYLVRERDPSPGPGFLEPRNDAVWTDYVGDGPYAERFIDRDTGEAQDRASFVPGIAQRDESAQPPTAVGRPWRPAEQPLYFHGDQIGTSRVLTDGAGLPARRVVYTAFGEPVFSEPPAQAGGLTRYLYAGAWGYETFNDAAFPFLHVGERWYDPATGRFLQRDPIGIVAGTNLYSYVRSRPSSRIDPNGLATIGIGFQLQITWFGFDISLNIGIHVDDRGNFLWTRTRCVGTASTPTASGSLTLTVTNANSVNNLLGFGSEVGGCVGSLSLAVVNGGPLSIEDTSKPYGGIQVGLGLGVGGAVYGEGSYTDQIMP